MFHRVYQSTVNFQHQAAVEEQKTLRKLLLTIEKSNHIEIEEVLLLFIDLMTRVKFVLQSQIAG